MATLYNVLSANAIGVSFNQRSVLKNITFNVNQGEIYALLGGNGAGKSTTLKTFLGLVKPDTGNALVMGHSILTELNAVRRNISYLPESVTLYGHLSGVENICYFLSLAGIKKHNTDIEEALSKVSLQADARRKPMSSYSKGMRQKTAIALALLRESPVLLLDEPTSGLDPSAIDEFNCLLSTITNAGSTVFMVTHDIYSACNVAHRVGLLNKGILVSSFERKSEGHIDVTSVQQAFSEYSQ